MNSPITKAIEKANSNGRCAFIPFLTAGYPDAEICIKLLQALDKSGADVIEVGLPFSDPLADGPVIQQSSQIALEKGMTPKGVLDLIKKAALSCPVVVMTYINPVMKMGFAEFAKKAKGSGVCGLIIPDMPLEESEEWMDVAKTQNLDTIFLVAPTTPTARMKKVAEKSEGFLYYVSMTGVTGSHFAVSEEMKADIKRAKSVSPVPVAIGFGISNADHAKALAPYADGVIVGSALIRQIQEHENAEDQIAAVSKLAKSLIGGLKKN